LEQLQQDISSVFSNRAGPTAVDSPGSTTGDVVGSSLPPMQPLASNQPCTSCVIGTWGEPLQLQLVAPEGPGGGSGALPRAVRVVVTHLQQVVLDQEVTLEALDTHGSSRNNSSSSGTTTPVTTSLLLTCDLLAAQANVAPSAESLACALTVNILPATPAQHPGSFTSPPAALPLAHITVLLLAPEPAAELAGWVAAHKLPAPYVSYWGADLAALLGCAQRLRAAVTSPLALQTTPCTSAEGAGAGLSKADLLQLCHLAVAAAGQLEGLFSGCGLGCVGDLVAVCKQRVLVGATALAPMAAGHVVPAARGWAGCEEVLGLEAAAAASIHVTVAAMLPASAAASGRADGLEESVGALGDLTHSTSIGSSRSGCNSSDGAAVGDPAPLAGAEHHTVLSAPNVTKVSQSAADGSSSSNTTGKATSPASSHPPPAPLVSPAEAAAVSGAGWGAWLLCWRGFRCPMAEAAFQSYRGAALRRWDWVCRVYVVVLGAAMVAKKVQVLEVPWVSWEAAPGEWLLHQHNAL
jgi:hypothetical protein